MDTGTGSSLGQQAQRAAPDWMEVKEVYSLKTREERSLCRKERACGEGRLQTEFSARGSGVSSKKLSAEASHKEAKSRSQGA